MKNIFLLVTTVLFYVTGINGQDSAAVSIPFEVYDNGIEGGGYKMLHFGLDQAASDTIDFDLGESNLPPAPPAGAFDARWILPKNNFDGSLSSWLDYRFSPGFPLTDTIEHRLKYQAKTGADTMFFKWDFPPEVTGLLQDLITGTLINVPVSGSGIFAFTNFAVLNQLKLTIYYDAILPVELTSFSAMVNGNIVHLNWITASEVNNRGFEVERNQSSNVKSQMSNQEWNTIGFIEGRGTTTEESFYSFVDDGVAGYKGIISYRLKQIDYDGTFAYSEVVNVEVDLLPQEFMLYQNYPNPFNPATVISWQLAVNSKVTLKVFSVLGQEVSILLDKKEFESGLHSLNFNAEGLNSGIYFYSIEINPTNEGIYKGGTMTKKMVVIK